VKIINPDFLLDLIGMASLLAAVILIFVLNFKVEKIRQLQIAVSKLKKSLEEMDEQAKLILRTDMELNKTQEELDKKLTGLYTLQRISRAISTTLEEIQIFKRIDAAHLEDLGFEKAFGFLWSEKENRFITYLNVGYLANEIDVIKNLIDQDKEFYLNLINTQKSISSISKLSDKQVQYKIKEIFAVDSFVISPILPKEGGKGFFFVGTAKMDTPLTEGDEELISILSNQIGQALENARLFEQTWGAHQELENKVKERTRELTLALEEVKKISKRKTDFISSVSHELRTPLTSIKGYAAILLAEKLGPLPPELKERLAKINRHSDELVHMINDLLDIARIESGRATMRIEKQDLTNLISAVSDLISIQFKNKNIELEVNIPKNTPSVLADRSQIERVFINLLGNAVKFTPQDGRITIKAHIEAEMVQVDITDTGIGIPPEAIPMIFDEFYRVDNSINQEVKGTGLGLSLVKNIIVAHQGKIWVESKVGKGATFSFTLPIK
jgi:signal transduction histidine kinase